MTGDAADLTVDPIVNLRDAHLVEMYLRRTSEDRRDQPRGKPSPPAGCIVAAQAEDQLGGTVAHARASR